MQSSPCCWSLSQSIYFWGMFIISDDHWDMITAFIYQGCVTPSSCLSRTSATCFCLLFNYYMGSNSTFLLVSSLLRLMIMATLIFINSRWPSFSDFPKHVCHQFSRMEASTYLVAWRRLWIKSFFKDLNGSTERDWFPHLKDGTFCWKIHCIITWMECWFPFQFSMFHWYSF